MMDKTTSGASLAECEVLELKIVKLSRPVLLSHDWVTDYPSSLGVSTQTMDLHFHMLSVIPCYMSGLTELKHQSDTSQGFLVKLIEAAACQFLHHRAYLTPRPSSPSHPRRNRAHCSVSTLPTDED